jgi:hypothetical protein
MIVIAVHSSHQNRGFMVALSNKTMNLLLLKSPLPAAASRPGASKHISLQKPVAGLSMQ